MKFNRSELNFTYNNYDKFTNRLICLIIIYIITYKITAWCQSFWWSQIQTQISSLCVSYVYLQSGYWNKNPTSASLSQSSFCKENPNLQDKQVSGNISRQIDCIITKILLFDDNKLDFEINKVRLMFTTEFILLTEIFSCLLIE